MLTQQEVENRAQLRAAETGNPMESVAGG